MSMPMLKNSITIITAHPFRVYNCSTNARKMATFYKKPNCIENAAKRKYGRQICVIGASQDDINQFLAKVKHTTLSASEPEEVGRAVLDIDCISHVNQAGKGDKEEKTADQFDELEITTKLKKQSSKSQLKSHHLQISSSSDAANTKFNFTFKVGDSTFFNEASVAPEVGAGSDKKVVPLNQQEYPPREYQVVHRIKVPPRTKVRAKIITWSVTYESKIHTKLIVDAQAFIPIRFRTWASILLGTLLGGACTSIGMLTAKELFANEEAFESEDGVVTFERDGKISYLGEDVEVIKEKIDF